VLKLGQDPAYPLSDLTTEALGAGIPQSELDQIEERKGDAAHCFYEKGERKKRKEKGKEKGTQLIVSTERMRKE